MVCAQCASALFPVQLTVFELGHALGNHEGTQAIACKITNRLHILVNAAKRRKLIQQQQRQIFQRLVFFRQCFGVLVNCRAEKQIDEQTGFGQAVWRDDDINAHLAAANVAQVEIIAAGGRIHHRIREHAQGGAEGGQNGSQCVVAVAHKLAECIQAVP